MMATKADSKPNIELLDATLAEVRKAARRSGTGKPAWSQAWFRAEHDCRTTMCFAGWAVDLTGADWDRLFAPGGSSRSPGTKYWGWGVAEEARRRLGLSDTQADALFYGCDTLADLTRIVGAIKAGRLQ